MKTNIIELKKSKLRKNKIIVAVSGGFDPVHVGHVRLFQAAKKLGDELVVILNNDNWLRNKKGFVFMMEEERKEIIETIIGVNRVVLTEHKIDDEDMSVCATLAVLKPHIFANGGDRYKHNIPEDVICEKIGCKMAFNVGYGGKTQSSSWLLNNYKKTQQLNEEVSVLSTKKLLVFDLDGTLAASKASIDEEMAMLLRELLEHKLVAVMSGGNYPQFQNQLLNYLECSGDQLKNLFILPTSGGRMYKHEKGKWRIVYKNVFTTEEKTKILGAFKQAFLDIAYVPPKKIYGKVIEDRESQITFSALGQKAPLKAKEDWNATQDIRQALRRALKRYLPEFEVRLGGLTSVDVTQKGIDKAYGIRQISKLLSVSKKDMAYVGDALYEGGNDFAVLKTRIDTVQVLEVEETKYLIRNMLFIKNKRTS